MPTLMMGGDRRFLTSGPTACHRRQCRGRTRPADETATHTALEPDVAPDVVYAQPAGSYAVWLLGL